MGAARRSLFRLRESRLASSRRLSARQGNCMSVDLNSRPRLVAGCRMGENNNQRVLLMAERALRLNGPSREIVSRFEGKHSVTQIISKLQLIYSKAEPPKVEQDI